jgi:hypothetical protein
MIQTHTVESIEVAIQMGVLLPATAGPKSRHRFWIGKYRVDAYLNRDRRLFIHWLYRPTGEHRHPRPDGCVQAHIGPEWWTWYRYNDGRIARSFTPSAAPKGTEEGAIGADV